MTVWKKKVAGILAIALCFGLVSCSSEESSSSSSGNSASSSAVETTEKAEADTVEEETGEVDTVEEETGEVDTVEVDNAEEETVEADTAGDSDVAEYEEYMEDLYDMSADVMSAVALTQVMMDFALENPALVAEATEAVTSKYAVLDAFAQRSAPAEVSELHFAFVEQFENTLTLFVDILGVVEEMTQLMIAFETQSEAEMMESMARMEEIMDEMEVLYNEFDRIGVVYEEVTEQMDEIFIKKLGQEYMDAKTAEMEEAIDKMLEEAYAQLS